jgi:hypothetical protein
VAFLGRHAPGIPTPYLETMTPAETRFVCKEVKAELKAELDLRIAFARAGRVL